ncbi:pectate lyase [Moniliophthora roreri MCA 2997]|uniref:Pectate lyase n=1 Tax=Moniliophthora roreri (strain MCA 2997) TaxID=1381753 RepID=V2XJ83_MONRO|nr:pectate lyase [Moniliophthora roreri MCA 2997]
MPFWFSCLSALASFVLTYALKVQLVPDASVDRFAEGYEIWRISNGEASASTTFRDLSLTLEAIGDTLNGNRYKVLQQAATTYLGEWLIGEGLSTENREGNIPLKLTVSGLSEGSHTLLAFHNGWDSLDGVSDLNIAINDEVILKDIAQTVRQNNLWDSASSYLIFNVTSSSEETTFTFTPIGSASDKRAYLNALEFDVKNIKSQVSFPDPPNSDEHVNADSGTYTLSFQAASDAASYDVYVSTESEDALVTATKDSDAYLGSITETSYDSRKARALQRLIGGESRQLAFPGAGGFGRYARGGRGGKVLRVTTLEDYEDGDEPIEGSFRWALSANSGPRIVVFDVGGVITLKSRLSITDKYVTIADQTVPGKGILFQGYTLGLSGATDIIIRHVRVRPGTISGTTIDGMGMRGSNHAIFDRCSISWTIDESFSLRDALNITLQRTLISEPLNAAGHKNYPEGTEHGYAASIGGNAGSFHHSLLAHAEGRSWSMAGGVDNESNFQGRLSIVNNVVYNYGGRVTDGGAHEVDFIGNYYKPGPASELHYALKATYEDNLPGTQQYYCEGNVMPGYFDADSKQVFDGEGAGACWAEVSIDLAPTYQYFLDNPFMPDSVEYQPAAQAYKRVLSDVGANIPSLDDHDKRII